MTKAKGPDTSTAVLRANRQVSKQDLAKYRKALSALSESYDDDIIKAMRYIDFRDIASARDSTIKLLIANIRSGSKAASRLASTWYDLVKERSYGYVDKPALNLSTYNEGAIDGFVRAEIETVVQSGQTATFKKAVVSRFNTDIKRSAFYCTFENGKRETNKLVKYARVLGSSKDTCRFCIMLSSLGYYYYTEEAASLSNHTHDNCQCTVVPGFFSRDGKTRYTDISGYDPVKIYDYWQSMLENKQWNADTASGDLFD